MSTIYIPKPDDEDRHGAINTLMDGLDRLYPGQIDIRQAITVTTDLPEVLSLLSSLFPPAVSTLPEAGAPAEIPAAKKARRQPPADKSGYLAAPSIESLRAYKRKPKSDPGSSSAPAGDSPLNVAPAGDPPVDDAPEKSASARQVFTWRLASGKECNDISHLLAGRQLAIGDRVNHRSRGLYEVTTKKSGDLTLKRLAS